MKNYINKILAGSACFLGGWFLGYEISKLFASSKSNVPKNGNIHVPDPMAEEKIITRTPLSDDSECKDQIHDPEPVEDVVIIPKEHGSNVSETKEQVHKSESDEEKVIIIELSSINSYEQEEQSHEPEPAVDGENISQSTKRRGRIWAVPVEVILQMKEMRDNGATYKNILEEVGSIYGLKHQCEVGRAIESLEKQSLNGEALS